MAIEKYTSPEAFRKALDERAKKEAQETSHPYDICRRKAAFEAFIMRIERAGNPLILKGGFVMDLRLSVLSRPSKDLDATTHDEIRGGAAKRDVESYIRTILDDICKIDLGDFFVFTVGAAAKELGFDRFSGFRFVVRVQIGGLLYDQFHVDISANDLAVKPLEELEVGKRLVFAGIKPCKILAIKIEQHFAEKLHAYARVRDGRPNTRVKDLVDMVLLLEQNLNPVEVYDCLRSVFAQDQGTLPETLPDPPATWDPQFNEMMEDINQNMSLQQALSKLRSFYEVVKEKGQP